MDAVFLRLLNMSLSAAVLVVAVVLLRAVFYKAPRWLHCLLWALVAVRLLCPITLESSLSLMPDTEAALSVVTGQSSEPQKEDAPPITDTPVVDTPVGDTPITDTPVETPPVGGVISPPAVTPTPDTPPSIHVVTPTPEVSVSTPTPEVSVDPWQVAVTVASYVWLAGVAAMAIYAAVTTLRLRRRVREAARITNRVWCGDHIRTPFILGVFRPRIYLPSDLSGAARDSVLAHEQAHLHRGDHWWKPLGFLLLTVYWFNPLMWVAYILLCRDIEAACDERVVRNMTAADRKMYSEALLSCSAPRRLVVACPLAFGETGVKSRIKSVLSYKKPTVWIIVAALLVSTVAGVCLLTDPKSPDPKSDTKTSTTPEEDEPEVSPEYAVFTHTSKPYAQVKLKLDGNGCTYTNSTSSDWMAEGTYEMTEDTVTLTFPDNSMTIVFDGDFAGLTLRMGRSDTRMSYDQMSYDGYELKDGAVFARTADVRAVSYTAPLTFSSFNWLSEDQQQELRQKYQYRTGSYSNNDWPIIPITSRAELDAFIAEYEDAFSFNKAEGDGLTPAHQMSFYDDAFFADKMLLAVYYRDSSSSVDPQIAAVEYNGAELVTVQVDVYEPSMQNAALGQWFMLAEIPRSEVKYATAYRAVIRDTIPTDHYWATYSHPVTVVDGDKPATGYYSIFEYGRETLLPLVEGLTWYGAEMNHSDFSAIGYFTFDGEKKYYVSADGNFLFDGAWIAALTAEDYMQLDNYLRDGNPGEKAATAFLTGKMVEWSKEGHYMLLEITDGDPKLGDRVKVSTRIMPPGSAPEKDASVTVFYDGYYEAGYIPTIYALYRTTGGYADLVGGPDDPGPVLDENTFVGKVTQVDDGRILMECYETEKFTTVWVSLANYPALRPQVGEEYVITHSGHIDETSPPQVTAELITPVSSTPPTTPVVPPQTDYTAMAAQVTGTVLEWNKEGEYILLEVNPQYAEELGEMLKVFTQYAPAGCAPEVGNPLRILYNGNVEKGSPNAIYAASLWERTTYHLLETGVDLYDDLLKEIVDYCYGLAPSNQAPDCSLQIFRENLDPMFGLGVKVMDLDKNGQNDLLISEYNGLYGTRNYVYDIYTIKDGKLVHLLSSHERNRYYLHEGGYISQEWAESARMTGTDFYRLEDGKLVFLERVTFDADYAVESGRTDTLSSVTADVAWFRTTVEGEDKDSYEPITAQQAEDSIAAFTAAHPQLDVNFLPLDT